MYLCREFLDEKINFRESEKPKRTFSSQRCLHALEEMFTKRPLFFCGRTVRETHFLSLNLQSLPGDNPDPIIKFP